MNRTSLGFIGASAGALALTGIHMALLPGPSAPEDNPSAELAVALIVASLAVAGAGAGLAVGARWARPISLLVALGCLAAGLCGLVVSGLYVGFSLHPTALSGIALLLLSGAAGVLLLKERRATQATAGEPPESSMVARLRLVALGALIGFGLAAIWSMVIAPMLDSFPCCPQ